MRLRLVRKANLLTDIHSFWFIPDKPVRFIAGQYIEIHVPHVNADNRGDKRWFTIVTTPQDQEVQIIMRIYKHGSSYKRALASLPLGTELYASDAIGDFVLPKTPDIPLTFVAAGIGITPFLSIITDMMQREENRSIDLIHAAATQPLLLSYDFLREAAVRYVPIISKPDSAWTGAAGYLSAKLIQQISGPDNKERLYFLSGPEPLIVQLIDDLYAHGIQRHQIVMDYFPGYK